MKLLSLRLCEHDSNFCLFDGESVRYFKLERKTNIKHDAYNDLFSWKQDVKTIFNVDIEDIDEIAIVVDAWLYEYSNENVEDFFPAIEWNNLNVDCPVWRVNHHYAHALSYWPITDIPDISVVIDGFGEHDVSWSVFKQDKILSKGSKTTNGSIGVLMAQVGEFLGIQSSHGIDYAGKLMGLQSYGKVDHDFLKKLNQYDMYNVKTIFDPNLWFDYKKDNLLANHFLIDWACTIHKRVEDLLIDFFKTFCNINDKVFYSGGVAQNIIWNTALKKIFPNLIIAPHSSDEGLSLGALEFLRRKNNLHKLSLPDFPFIQSDQHPLEQPNDNIIKETAYMLSVGKTVAWYQGNGEIGPRALGNRSILMRPDLPKEKINEIKRRENYRPFGASILKERLQDYFYEHTDSPYMLYSFNFKEKIYSAIRHIDGSCRVQTVDSRNRVYKKLLEEFFYLTQIPILLNTSLNLAGMPLAGSEELAIKIFNESSIDVLVFGNKIIKK